MLLTPEEAKKEDCPLTRIKMRDGLSAAITFSLNCQGPDCKMGWRWEEIGDNHPHKKCNPDLACVDGRCYLCGNNEDRAKLKGYCGLAGKP